MGVRAHAVIILGATKEDFGYQFSELNGIHGFMKDDKFISMDTAGFEWIESLWDSNDPKDIIYGFVVDSTDAYQPHEINIDMNKIDALKIQFKKITGFDGKLYLSPWMM